MNKIKRLLIKSKNKILIFICIIFWGGFLYDKFGVSTKTWSYFTDSLKLLFTALTTVIALKIYDRFGLNKKLSEKRTELIVELLIELKKIYFRADIDDRIWAPFSISKDMSNQLKHIDAKDQNIKILFHSEDFDIATEKILILKNNPLMPKSISEKLSFIEISGGQNSRELREIHKTKLFFTRKSIDDRKEEKHWMVKSNNNCSLKEFILKFNEVFIEIEIWIEKHSNLDEKLNI